MLSRARQAVAGAVAAFRPALVAALVLFVVQGLVLGVLASVGLMTASVAVILAVGALLAAVAAVLLQLLVLRPLGREFERRLSAQARSQRSTSVTDAVTGLLSRRAITSSLLEAMAQAERYRHPLSVVLARIDRFRQLNTELGRRSGERILQGMAGVFFETLRMPDRAGRYGEEEFLIVLPHTALKDAERIAARIRESVAVADFGLGNGKPRITLSIGATRFRNGEDLEYLVSRVAQRTVGPEGARAAKAMS